MSDQTDHLPILFVRDEYECIGDASGGTLWQKYGTSTQWRSVESAKELSELYREGAVRSQWRND